MIKLNDPSRLKRVAQEGARIYMGANSSPSAAPRRRLCPHFASPQGETQTLGPLLSLNLARCFEVVRKRGI